MPLDMKRANGLKVSRPASQGQYRAELNTRLVGIGRRSPAPTGVLREAKRRGSIELLDTRAARASGWSFPRPIVSL